MTTSDGVGDTRRRRLRSAARFAIAALTVTAVALTVLVWRAVADGPAEAADVGETIALQAAPYGRELTVVLPGSEVTAIVGAPVDAIDHQLLDVEYDDPRWSDSQDLVASDDGSLVPITWSIRALGGFLREDDPTPIKIRLVAGDQRVHLTSVVLDDTSASVDAFAPRSVAVALDGETDIDDLAVEVEYDGLTQTAHVATGEVVAGVAQALYDDRSYTAGCTEVENPCAFRAADPASTLRPDQAHLIASYVTLYPYDARLGWAADGTLWAGVRLHLFGSTSFENAAGGYWLVARQSAPSVTLDGAVPVRREGLPASRLDTVGRVVFRVDADAEPRELTVEQVVSLKGPRAPADLPMRAQLDLTTVANERISTG